MKLKRVALAFIATALAIWVLALLYGVYLWFTTEEPSIDVAALKKAAVYVAKVSAICGIAGGLLEAIRQVMPSKKGAS
jgi:hypothetical protein